MNWATVKSLAIPVGGVSRDVKRVSIGGAVVWEKPSPLPYDAEVEYLQADGNAYIDTGRPIGSGFWFEATLKIIGTNTQYKSILGARTGSGVDDYQFSLVTYGSQAQNRLLARYGTNSSQFFAEYPATEFLTVRVDSDYKLYFNGALAATLGFASPSSQNLFLFALNDNGTARQNLSNLVRVYGIKYGDSSGQHDFIPVRVGSVGYLYDRVSGALFGNAGTGDFVVGQDVVPVEYLQFAGTTSAMQYIDTGVKVSDPSKLKIEAVADRVLPFGFTHNFVGGGTWVAAYMATDLSIITVYNKNASAVSRISPPATVTSFSFDGSAGFYVNDSAQASFTASVGSDDISSIPWRFGEVYDFYRTGGYTTSAFNRSGKVASLKMWVDSALVRKYYPVRVGTDATSWEGALMDTLTRRIYRNQGTGAFSYGNDLPYPIGG